MILSHRCGSPFYVDFYIFICVVPIFLLKCSCPVNATVSYKYLLYLWISPEN